MQCHSAEIPSSSRGSLTTTETHGKIEQNEIYSTPRWYITDPGVVDSWQVTVTSDNCALRRHPQGWQVCLKLKTI